MFIDLIHSLNCVIVVCYPWWSFTLGSIGDSWNWICYRDNEVRHKKNAWDYMMEDWGSLVDCPCESDFNEYLKNFEMTCSPWSMFVDYVCQTWVIPHKEKFVKAWTNKVMHLGNTTTNMYEYCFLFVLICLSVELIKNVAVVYTLLYNSFVGLRLLIGH